VRLNERNELGIDKIHAKPRQGPEKFVQRLQQAIGRIKMGEKFLAQIKLPSIRSSLVILSILRFIYDVLY
jgi:hypothetical protein